MTNEWRRVNEEDLDQIKQAPAQEKIFWGVSPNGPRTRGSRAWSGGAQGEAGTSDGSEGDPAGRRLRCDEGMRPGDEAVKFVVELKKGSAA